MQLGRRAEAGCAQKFHAPFEISRLEPKREKHTCRNDRADLVLGLLEIDSPRESVGSEKRLSKRSETPSFPGGSWRCSLFFTCPRTVMVGLTFSGCTIERIPLGSLMSMGFTCDMGGAGMVKVFFAHEGSSTAFAAEAQRIHHLRNLSKQRAYLKAGG